MQELKIKMREAIKVALEQYQELYDYEESTDFDDAMDGFERKYAEGYADGLLSAYYQIFGESYEDDKETVDVD